MSKRKTKSLQHKRWGRASWNRAQLKLAEQAGTCTETINQPRVTVVRGVIALRWNNRKWRSINNIPMNLKWLDFITRTNSMLGPWQGRPLGWEGKWQRGRVVSEITSTKSHATHLNKKSDLKNESNFSQFIFDMTLSLFISAKTGTLWFFKHFWYKWTGRKRPL